MSDQPSAEALSFVKERRLQDAAEFHLMRSDVEGCDRSLALACDAFAAAAVERDEAVEKAVAAERERCERLARGKIYAGHYRTWPHYGSGQQSANAELTIFADAIGDAIRDEKKP